MNRNEILQKAQEICRDIFEDDLLVVSEETSSSDIEGWDSLTHLSLVSELEEAAREIAEKKAAAKAAEETSE